MSPDDEKVFRLIVHLILGENVLRTIREFFFWQKNFFRGIIW